MSTVTQRAFSAGELDPALHARTDYNKFYTGAKKIKNWIVKQQGGVENRPGTEFISEIHDSTKSARLIPFDAGAGAQYALEFGDESMRVVKDGAMVSSANASLTAISAANPAVVTYSGADIFTAGDRLLISGVAGDLGPYINGRTFRVGTVTAGSNLFNLLDADGNNFNSSTLPAYTSGGTAYIIYKLTSPYDYLDLPSLKYAQSVDTMTFAEASYPVYNLVRTSDASWAIALNELVSDVTRPSALTGAFSVGTEVYRYVVTAVRASDGRESLPATVAGSAINADTITKAVPPVVTGVFSAVYDGDVLLASTVAADGMIEINNRTYVAKIAAATSSTTTFQLLGEDSTNYTTYVDTGRDIFIRCTIRGSALALSSTNQFVLRWNYASADVAYYKIYRANGDGEFGLIGTSNKASFYDIGYTQNFAEKFPLDRNIFRSANNYPSCVSYAQQRLFFANTNNDPERVDGTSIGDYSSFTVNDPIRDSDSVSFKAASNKFNPVKHIVDLSKLVLMTENSEIVVNPDGSVIAPTNIAVKANSYNGCTDLRPIVLNDTALYVEKGGQIVRDLLFDFQIDGLSGGDISIYAAHLFEGREIVAWAYQKKPNSIVWVAMDDGKVLSLTYLKEQQVLAWTQHEFDGGFVEDVCSVSNGSSDDVYFIIKRTINGRTVRYIERLSERFVSTEKQKTVTVDGEEVIRTYDSVIESKIMDSSLSYDGRATTATVTITDDSGWTTEDTVNVEVSDSSFVAADVGNQIHVYTDDGDVLKLEITEYSDADNVICQPINMDVPEELQDVDTTDWGMAVDELSGLWHLEGENVSVLADGYVKHNPNNDDYDVKTVTNGQITLDDCYVVIHVGLPITADLKTLNIDTVNGETLIDKKINIQKVIMYLNKTRGLLVGQDEDGDLQELKMRDEEPYNKPISLKTGPAEVTIESEWNSTGSVFVRQTDPLPANISSISLAGYIPMKG